MARFIRNNRRMLQKTATYYVMHITVAAGVIHSDLQRGFIRAEVMKYDDFVRLGSEAKCREAGKLRLEGKSYIVQDGDVMEIRANA